MQLLVRTEAFEIAGINRQWPARTAGEIARERQQGGRTMQAPPLVHGERRSRVNQRQNGDGLTLIDELPGHFERHDPAEGPSAERHTARQAGPPGFP